MAISSASTRIFRAEDPVMQTDLNLLAEVNQYEERNFQVGEESIQNEINNWALLRNVAKPQDREYINAKLNSVVAGIKNLGGVDLGDINNVNQIKSLGYSMYGDKNVMDPVTTTKRMQALQQDIYNKTNGKEAKNYDSVYGEYLTSQYSEWLNDGKQGTSFDGPTTLPQGSFDNYNKKIKETIDKIQPDINESPKDLNDAAFNYYQVGDKFIKKEKIEQAISAVTSPEDMDLMKAYAWKSMRPYHDNDILNFQLANYDSKLQGLRDNRNYLTTQMGLNSNNFAQVNALKKQRDEIDASIKQFEGVKSQVGSMVDKPLPKDVREQLETGLYFDSFKDQYATARAYDQQKIELKTNQGRVAAAKMDQQAYFFGKNYDLKDKEYKLHERAETLKEEELGYKWGMLYANGGAGFLGLRGPGATAPLSIQKVNGKDDAIHLDSSVNDNADANYVQKSKEFYTQGYNYLMSKSPDIYGKYLKKDDDGNWVPKDDQKSTDVVNNALDAFNNSFSNVANLSIEDRKNLKFNEDDIELYRASTELQNARLYKSQMNSVTDGVFAKAGLESPNSKKITINFKPGSRFGKSVTKTYAELREMDKRQDPLLKAWEEDAAKTGGSQATQDTQEDAEIAALNKKYGKKPFGSLPKEKRDAYQKELSDIQDKYGDSFFGSGIKRIKQTVTGIFNPSSQNSVHDAIDVVGDYYDNGKVKDAWEDISKTLNPYGAAISLPKDKKGKPNEQLVDVLYNSIQDGEDKDAKNNVKKEDIDLVKVYAVSNFTDPDPDKRVKYMAEVRYKKGGSSTSKKDQGDKLTTIDITPTVLQGRQSLQNDPTSRDPNSWFSTRFADDDNQIVYGFSLQKDGMTPNPKDPNAPALQTHGQGLLSHKYQVIAIKDPKTNGITGYRVQVAIPIGNDKSGRPQLQMVPVPYFQADPSGSVMNFPNDFKAVESYMEAAFGSAENAQDFYRRLGASEYWK